MYPRGNNNSTADYGILQSSFKKSNNNINTRDAEYASSSTQLPLLEDHDGVILSYLLSQQHFLMVDDTAQVGASVDQNEISLAAAADAAPEQAVTVEEEIPKSKKKKKAAASPRKRCSGKKDRHSKICTAQGPRDRRMRLSLQIARKFFDLQDMLGFDKASKTIDWLFTKSRSAVQELKQHLTSSSPNCIITRNFGAAAESVKYSCSTNTDQGNDVASKTMEMRHSDQKKSVRNLCMVAKGSRDEARARARERTREKMRIRSSSGSTSQDHEANPDANLGFCLGEELAENPTYHHLFEQGGLNSMMSTDVHQKSTSLMVDGSTSSDYSRSRPIANFEEAGEFPGFSSGNWGNTNMQPFRNTVTASMIEPFTGKNVLQVENPSTSSNSQEQNYSLADTSVFMTPKTIAQEDSLNGCCSINFITSQDLQDQNPNPMFSTTLISQHYQNSRQFL